MRFKKFLPEFVYGSIDGTVTTLAVVAGAMGASLGLKIIIIMGLANLVADGFSMAMSNYASLRSADKDNKSKQGKKEARKRAGITFSSFLLIGFIPLVPFSFGLFKSINLNLLFLISIFCTGLAFMLIGLIKAKVNQTSILTSIVKTLSLGALAAGLAFGVGYGLEQLIQSL